MISPLWEWAKKQGLATILVLVGVGVFTGYVPSPLSTTADILLTHAGQMEAFLKESRYQTALLAVVCRRIANPSECFDALMKEHLHGLNATPEDKAAIFGADSRGGDEWR